METEERFDGMSRRRFLAATGGALLVLGGAGCVSRLKGTLPVDVVGDTIVFPFSRFPELAKIDGYAVAGPVTIGAYEGNVYIKRLGGGKAMVLGAKCRHLGCDVEWNADRSLFVCPCHGSEYGPDGELVKGPAKKGLYEWPARVEGDKVVLPAGQLPLRG